MRARLDDARLNAWLSAMVEEVVRAEDDGSPHTNLTLQAKFPEAAAAVARELREIAGRPRERVAEEIACLLLDMEIAELKDQIAPLQANLGILDEEDIRRWAELTAALAKLVEEREKR